MADTAQRTDRERIDRLETAVAELAAGMKLANGWRPDGRAPAVVDVVQSAAAHGGMERRPHTAPERRVA
jgi:hypothetical protein